jgi:hypothetical protein
MHNTENNQQIDMQTEKLGDLIAMHNTENNQQIDMQTEKLKTLLAENNANISASLHALTNDISGLKIPLLQNDTLVRWQILDAIDDLLYPPHTPVTCPVCGNSAPKSTLAVKTADCIYNGGRLDRFECPRCGAIFGPLKMLVMNQAQLATEYRQCYSVFSESSDTEELERSAFFDLSPDFDGVYLNYGAGAWNKTSEHLRSQGYKVYDYEPYAPATDSPWLLRSQEELRQLKFDGIFSNDLIEHLRNPVEALRSMADLLKQGGPSAQNI